MKQIIVLCMWKWPLFSPFQSKFLSFYQYAKNFNSDNFDYDSLENSDYVYMRWKEHFLVPDHTIRDIHGASFAGFYYICFQRSTSSIEGYYFHRNSEWYVTKFWEKNINMLCLKSRAFRILKNVVVEYVRITVC